MTKSTWLHIITVIVFVLSYTTECDLYSCKNVVLFLKHRIETTVTTVDSAVKN
jgi:hypothetical protein